MLRSPRGHGWPNTTGGAAKRGGRGSFWAGPAAEATMNGHRLRFFDPPSAPSFPAIAIGDFVDAIALPDLTRDRVVRWMRRTFASEIRWRWTVTLPLGPNPV